LNPLIAQLTHAPFTQVADALRSRRNQITVQWDAAVRKAMPELNRLSFDELKDSVPKILSAIADAMASADLGHIDRLVATAPMQGLTRFRQEYDLAEIMQEDRLLRGIIVFNIEDAMNRQMTREEAASLHATVDVMLQRAAVALAEQQKAQLREAAERELKYVSFLSHDLNNNLGGVTLMLKLLRQELRKSDEFADAAGMLDSAQRSIQETIEGMRRMLEHERLRKVGAVPAVTPLNLHAYLSNLARDFGREAQAKGLGITVEAPEGPVVRSDPELMSLVFRNLVGNAVKFATKGSITLRAHERQVDTTKRWVVSVEDEGPGIAPEHMSRIFEAFRRGEAHAHKGVGLGLAIASQAAKLLGAELTVESELGKGSTFLLTLPPASRTQTDH
jgi:signal transduction histidine kinase